MPKITDPKCEDEYGKDPYRVRTSFPSVKKHYDATSFAPMLQELSLVEVEDHSKQKSIAKDEIPKRFHSIWFGCEFPPYSKANRIFNIPDLEEWVASLRKINPSFDHILWTDKEDYEKSDSKVTEEFCKKNGMALLVVQDLFPAEGDFIEQELYRLYCIERRLQNYTACADIIRVLIIRRLAGIYMDVDNNALRALTPEDMIAKLYGFKTNIKNKTYNNDIIASCINNPNIDKLCLRLLLNYRLSLAKLLRDKNVCKVGEDIHSATCFDYSKTINYLSAPLYFVYRFRTILGTGPAIIGGFCLAEKIPDKNLTQMTFENDAFKTRSEQLWLRGESDVMYDGLPIKEFQLKFASEEEARIDLTTNILFYHQLEPRTLRFDYYRLNFDEVRKTNKNFESDMFQQMLTDYPTLGQNIEYVGFSNFETFLQNYKVLLDRKKFPALRLELYLMEIQYLLAHGLIGIEAFQKIDPDIYTVLKNDLHLNPSDEEFPETVMEKLILHDEHVVHRYETMGIYNKAFILAIKKFMDLNDATDLIAFLKSPELEFFNLNQYAKEGKYGLVCIKNKFIKRVFTDEPINAELVSLLLQNNIQFKLKLDVLQSFIANMLEGKIALPENCKAQMLQMYFNKLAKKNGCKIILDCDVTTLDKNQVQQIIYAINRLKPDTTYILKHNGKDFYFAINTFPAQLGLGFLLHLKEFILNADWDRKLKFLGGLQVDPKLLKYGQHHIFYPTSHKNIYLPPSVKALLSDIEDILFKGNSVASEEIDFIMSEFKDNLSDNDLSIPAVQAMLDFYGQCVSSYEMREDSFFVSQQLKHTVFVNETENLNLFVNKS